MFNSSLRSWAPTLIRRLERFVHPAGPSDLRHAPSAFLSMAFRYARAAKNPGRGLELHRRFLESIGDQLDTVPGILSCEALRSFDPTGERI
jgi:hypothetical protein